MAETLEEYVLDDITSKQGEFKLIDPEKLAAHLAKSERGIVDVMECVLKVAEMSIMISDIPVDDKKKFINGLRYMVKDLEVIK
jgi:hypothetical protein